MDTHANPPTQAFHTEGVQSQMERPGLLFRMLTSIIHFVERQNVKCAKAGNLPVFKTSAFPWASEVEGDWRKIRAELDKVLTRRDELPGFHEIAKEVEAISQDKNWKSFMLCAYGHVSDEAVKACPDTWKALQKIPGLKAAMFSIFEPGKHLPAHRGPYNGVLRYHLGLIVPKGDIAIRVVDQICHWEEGKSLIFDDAFEHEAWNHSDKVRVVLFVDFVKPLRFPANFLNWLLLNIAVFTPFIREGYQAQKRWEKAFFGDGKVARS
jgi:ornithine lipid ester-linked acyl 2-hydroxylase